MTIERIRLTFDVPDRVRRALNIVAARQVCSVGDVITQLVEESFPDALADADKAIAEGKKPKKGRRPREGGS